MSQAPLKRFEGQSGAHHRRGPHSAMLAIASVQAERRAERNQPLAAMIDGGRVGRGGRAFPFHMALTAREADRDNLQRCRNRPGGSTNPQPAARTHMCKESRRSGWAVRQGLVAAPVLFRVPMSSDDAFPSRPVPEPRFACRATRGCRSHRARAYRLLSTRGLPSLRGSCASAPLNRRIPPWWRGSPRRKAGRAPAPRCR